MHSLPLALVYELGFVGLALVCAVVGLFFLRRWRGRGSAVDRGLVEAGLAGVAGFLLTSLGGAQLSVTALPLAAALAAGAALAGGGAADTTLGQRGAPGGRLAPAPRRLGGSGLDLRRGCRGGSPAARPRAGALRSSRRPARRGPRPRRSSRARMALDPEFALYSARWAWSSDAPVSARAVEAIAAARSCARCRGPLAAGRGSGARRRAGGPRARSLRNARWRSIPLSGFAAFQLATRLAMCGGHRHRGHLGCDRARDPDR